MSATLTPHRFRIWHAILAAVTMLAYVTGEAGRVHDIIGYGVAALVTARIAWGLAGRQGIGLGGAMGPARMVHPALDWLGQPWIGRALLAGVALSVCAAALTGMALDAGVRRWLPLPGALGLAELAELHEAVSDLLLALVALHVGHLLVFRPGLVRHMAFARRMRGS